MSRLEVAAADRLEQSDASLNSPYSMPYEMAL